jgi:hypothetical protein
MSEDAQPLTKVEGRREEGREEGKEEVKTRTYRWLVISAPQEGERGEREGGREGGKQGTYRS